MPMTDDELNKALESYKLAFLIRINYKSGITQEFWCTEFDCQKRGGEITTINWQVIPGLLMPLSIVGELTDIESIYQVEARPLESVLIEGREIIEQLIDHCKDFDEDKS